MKQHKLYKIIIPLLGIGFIISSITGFLGYGSVVLNGKIVEGKEKLISLFMFFLIGFFLLLIRFTVLKDKKSKSKPNFFIDFIREMPNEKKLHISFIFIFFIILLSWFLQQYLS